jgi:hypothetical protein
MTRRREFTSETKRQAYERSGGICECHRVPWLPTFGRGCGCALGPGNVFYEHIIPDNIGGDNSLDNCAVLCKTCWRAKTDTYDLPVIADANRQRDRARGIRPRSWRPLPGGRDSDMKIRVAGGPVDRRTGQPWRGWR